MHTGGFISMRFNLFQNRTTHKKNKKRRINKKQKEEDSHRGRMQGAASAR